MQSETNQFLLIEFSTAFDAIRSITERRIKFLEFLISLHAVLLTVVVALIVKDSPQSPSSTFIDSNDVFLAWSSSFIALIATYTILRIMRSERRVQVRYLHKINHIRGIFLLGDTDPVIREYLASAQKTGAYTTNSEDDSQLAGSGSPLMGMFSIGWGLVATWIVGALLLTILS